MAEVERIYKVDRQPEFIPSGCTIAWDTSTTPPRIWYVNGAGNITQWTGGITNPLSSSLNAGGYEITNAATPTSASSLATKSYVDSAVSSGGGLSVTTGTVTSTANWGAASITYQYYGKVLTIRQQLAIFGGYTGNEITTTGNELPTAMRPNATTYKPFTYYDDSASAYYTGNLVINTDGTIDYYPPAGITPANGDLLQIFVSYLKT